MSGLRNTFFPPGCGSCSKINAFCYTRLLFSKLQFTAGSVALSNLCAKQWVCPRNARNSLTSSTFPHNNKHGLSLPISLLLSVWRVGLINRSVCSFSKGTIDNVSWNLCCIQYRHPGQFVWLPQTDVAQAPWGKLYKYLLSRDPAKERL